MTSSLKAREPEVIVHIDGASRGNPGPAAYAVVVESPGGSPLAAFSKYLGEATNNYAEYQALLAALESALNSKYRRIRVLTDSELLARQITGQYKVRHAALKPLHEQARGLIARFEAFSIEYVPREQNREADRLANQALDAAGKGASPARPRTEGPGRARPALISSGSAPTFLRASATYEKGTLKLHQRVALEEGEEVEVQIRRR
jgi:ribonuclease HI